LGEGNCVIMDLELPDDDNVQGGLWSIFLNLFQSFNQYLFNKIRIIILINFQNSRFSIYYKIWKI
jgi:hypothetical protein